MQVILNPLDYIEEAQTEAAQTINETNQLEQVEE